MIYAMQESGPERLVKIGFTGKPVQNRAQQLRKVFADGALEALDLTDED